MEFIQTQRSLTLSTDTQDLDFIGIQFQDHPIGVAFASFEERLSQFDTKHF